MSTPGPQFLPTPFATPIVNPATASFFRRSPYISPSDYVQAPTAVATNALVPGGNPAQNLAELAAVVMRASDWLDTICFHRGDGTLAASPSTEQNWILPKPNGLLVLICNYRPILEVDAVALGPAPSQMQNITENTSGNIWIQGKTISLPTACSTGTVPSFGGYPVGPSGRIFAIWTYVNGYPHVALAQNATAGSSTITVDASQPGGTTVYGVYAGTQLTIHDSANTEVVVVQDVDGLTLTVQAPLLYAHTVPNAPDAILVSAVPWAIQQACVSLISCLIKMRGTRANVMPSIPGKVPSQTALIQSGAQADYEAALHILAPYTTTFIAQ